MSFEENRGQAPTDVAFLSRGSGWRAALRTDGVDFRLMGSPVVATGFRVEGARTEATWKSRGLQPGRINYFIGNDSSRWITGVRHYSEVRSQEVRPGVALVWRAASGGRLRYDLEFEPGIDPQSVRLDFRGVERLRVEEDGSLRVEVPGGWMRHSAPLAWQTRGDGRRVRVPCRFHVTGGSIRFGLGRRDPALRTTIDPTIDVSTKFMTGDITTVVGTAQDPDANVVVAGYTNRGGFATSGAYRDAITGSFDTYVAAFPPGESSFSYLTYFGGTGQENCEDLALDGAGGCWVAGWTNSTNMPVIQPAQGTSGGGRDAFVAHVGAGGASLIASSYFGGNDEDYALAVVADREGGAWLAGYTRSDNLPTVNVLDSVRVPGDTDAFLARFSPAGNQMLVASYLGGSAGDVINDLALAWDGTLWCTGYSLSTDYPTVDAWQGSPAGMSDAILTAISAAGTEILYSTYLGGTGTDTGEAVMIDDWDGVVVGGGTGSDDFPTMAAYQPSLDGGQDGFVARFEPSTGAPEFVTYLGGSDSETVFALATDGAGQVHAAGSTLSADFPQFSAVDGTFNGGNDLFLTVFARGGGSVTFSGFYGGSGGDLVTGAATDGAVTVLAGSNSSADLPEVNGRGEGVSGQFWGGLVVLRHAPDPMRKLRATDVGFDVIDLAWDDPHDGAYDYLLERRLPGGEFSTIATIDAGTTTFEDADVDEDVRYFYRIRGVSESGETAVSSRFLVKSLLQPPGAPTAAAIANDKVLLEWEDDSGVELAYEVRRRFAFGSTWELLATLQPGGTSFLDDEVVPETSYEYEIRTLGPSGVPSPTEVLPVTTPPMDPKDLGVEVVSDVAARLLWTDQSLRETGFEIQRRNVTTNGAFEPAGTVLEDETLFVDSGASGETEFEWRVRAVNEHGASYWTPVASLTTPPNAPTGLLVEALDPERVSLSWDDNSAAEDEIFVERRGPGEMTFSTAATLPPDAESYLDDTRSQREKYEYRVRTSNEHGVSRAADTVQVTTPRQLVLRKATLRPAKGTRPARLTVSGLFDAGPEAVDFSGAGEIQVAGTAFPFGAMTPRKGGWRLQTEDLRLDLVPDGASAASFKLNLVLEGAVPAAVDPNGEVFVSLFSDGSRWSGGAALSSGRFNAARGIGEWGSPSMTLETLRAAFPEFGVQSVALKVRFRPDEAPLTEVPDIVVRFGVEVDAAIDGALFVERNGRWSLLATDPSPWQGKLDPAAGTLSLTARDIQVGAFPAGEIPVRVEILFGDRRFVDEIVVVSTGKSLRY